MKEKEGARSVATADDVARLAGVSKSAVSRSFTPGASVAPATRKRVLEAAEAIGYQPNLIARTLISGRSNIVGVGIGNLQNPFFAVTLEALSIELAAAGLRLLLFHAGPDEMEASVQEVLQYRLDALILLSTSLSSPLSQQCSRASIPVVLYNRIAQDPAVSSVTGNNKEGARSVAAFLVAGQHDRIAFMAGMEESSTSRHREEGFNSFFAEHGLPAPIRDCGRFDQAEAAAAARRLLSRRDRPDAIFCANDAMALVTIDIAQAEFGLDVGRELSIVGYDDVPMAAWPGFSLTTYAQPLEQMVSETVSIIRGFGESNSAPVQRVLEGNLIVRASARRPVRSPKAPHDEAKL